jgi:hypothetical protein
MSSAWTRRCSVMSRAIFETPMMAPVSSRIGEMVAAT